MPVISSLDKARRQQAVQRSMADRVRRVGQFVLRKLAQKRAELARTHAAPAPLVVGVNGPQGSGKTTLAHGLAAYLRTHHVGAHAFSLDDVYLRNAEQQRLAERTQNPLLRFRGQPGTHDVALARATLESLLGSAQATAVPAFDKSLCGGRGDRLPPGQWAAVPPVDVVLLEGWCLGFRSLDACEFARFLANTHAHSSLCKYSGAYADEHLAQVNANLREYEAGLYPLVDSWVWLRAADLDVVFRWRKDQEDERAAQGRAVLSDQQLEDFVSRFMPGYEMALPKLDSHGFIVSGLVPDHHTLRVHLDLDRNVVAIDHHL
ncbi:hypothetical protein H4S02_007984 [Coemansia sp. RSA 2611]|nr:hypothetical protein IWW54_003550 [Coemansia sp. RSA 2705]KAJ2325509.1 hypothetical protein IWW51_002755 [Coemansia sp. RSA 2702]KAJ2368906.1 hypothetical protein H4S01_001317 [Coemansia sp. RSA 2610]KAJ2376229.1 hypothetical protein H4S02_007984 [Coemansia sp. RSA 2611]KAJ2738929.1 hypothetical protein H4R23_000808 [Coemansia sp. Cherry 401B]